MSHSGTWPFSTGGCVMEEGLTHREPPSIIHPPVENGQVPLCDAFSPHHRRIQTLDGVDRLGVLADSLSVLPLLVQRVPLVFQRIHSTL